MKQEQQKLQFNDQQLRYIQSKQEKIRIKAKKSIQKRASVDFKGGLRDSQFIRRQQTFMEQSFRVYLYSIDRYIQAIDEFCSKHKLSFLMDLKAKLSQEEYKLFWNNISLFKLYDGCKLQEEGKYHANHYVLIEGNVAAYKQNKVKEEQRQFIEYFQYEQGVVLLSNTLENHKYNPYTVKAKTTALFLMFTDQFYQKFLKKIVTKQHDQVASILSHSLLFRGITAIQLKRYIPYCSFETFKYNQLVYQEGDLIRQIFLILDGQIQIGFDRQDIKQPKQDLKKTISLTSANIYRLTHQNIDKKEIKIVKVCKKELFGLEAYDVFKQNYYEHHVRVTSNVLKVLCIRLDVLQDLQMEYPNLEQNLSSYLKKINQMHFKLLEKCQQISVSQPITKKKKKNRKKKKKPQILLQWWGLAEKLEGSKQYRLPQPPPKLMDLNNQVKRKEPLAFQNRTNKLDYFKRKLLEQQIKHLQSQQQKENDVMITAGGLIPRLQKVKIKMVNTKPKVVNIAQRTMKKLMEYAKNDQVFCDKLQLQ